MRCGFLEVVSGALAAHLCVFVCVRGSICACACLPMIEKSGAGSQYRPISPSSRERIPLDFSLLFLLSFT